jgi:NADH-quinone oxidoreductase subunit E
VVTVDYEFYDQQDVDSARELVAALRRGEKPLPTRGAPLTDFRGISRQLAGFSQHTDEAAARAAVDSVDELGPTLIGLRLADERGESAPAMPEPENPAADSSGSAAAAEQAGAEQADLDAPQPARRDTGDGGGTDTPAGQEPGTSGQGPEGSRRTIEGRGRPRRKG